MKISIVMPLAEQRGGGELMLWHLMQQGRGGGVDWQVLFLEDGPLIGQVQALGVETRLIPAGRMREPHRFATAIGRIAAEARRRRSDLILSWMGKPHLYGSPAARLAGIPALWYQLGVPTGESRVDRLATRLPARGILTCSQAGAKAQARLRPSRPTRVVYPGVELERFDPATLPTPAAARRALGLPTEGPLIGIVGRLQRWKGMHVLVEAMPEILRVHPDARCVLVGGKHDLEPDYSDYLESRIAALGVGDRVTLTGLQRNIPEWMQAMDVVVHASDHEPFGIVIIEAMALGKPVVAGNAAGPTEIITDGVHGLLTPYGDSTALAGAILRYLDDTAFARRVGAEAQRRAQEFSTQRYAQNLIAAVRNLLQGSGTVAG